MPSTLRVRPVLIAATFALLGCSRSAAPIRIGVAGPFSQARGASMHDAAVLAANEINQAGGIDGRPIQLVFRDDSTSIERAVAIAHAFYADPRVVAVVGHLTSGTTIAAAPVYNADPTPLLEISPSASSPALTGAGPYTFRVCPTDLLHGSRLAAWARDSLGARTAAVIYQDDDYGRGVRAVFKQRFTAKGGTIVADDPYLDALPSFEPYLRLLKQHGGADVLMIAGTRPGAERILPLLDSVGLAPRVMGGDGLAGLEAAGPMAEGVYISTAYLPDRPGATNQAFVKRYAAAYGGRVPDHRGAGAYDIVRLLARALRAVGPDRARLRDYLAGVGTKTPAFEGVTGRIAFDEHGDVPDKDVVIGVVHNGALVTAKAK